MKDYASSEEKQYVLKKWRQKLEELQALTRMLHPRLSEVGRVLRLDPEEFIGYVGDVDEIVNRLNSLSKLGDK